MIDLQHHTVRPRRATIAAIVTIAVSALAACGGGDDASKSPSPQPSAIVSTAAVTKTEIASTPTSATVGTPPLTASTPAESSAAALCDLSIPDATPGAVASPDLIEISGLAASRAQDVLWAHNDSGDTARVFAVGLDGAALATYTLNGAEAVDWEDMAVGPGPDASATYLYLGDIGDNAAARPQVVVYRVPEPEVSPAASSLTVDADAIALTYPDGPHDAETLLVDPVTGDLFIVTKDITGGPSGLYRASAASLGAPPVTLERVATIDFAALTPQQTIPAGAPPLPSGLPKVPTGGDISPDGSRIAVRTYGTVWVWQRSSGSSVADAFAAAPCEGPSALEPQGEAIAFLPNSAGYVTASEGANPPLHQFRPQ